MDKTTFTEAEAIALFKSKWWEGKTAEEIVKFQLFTSLLCMPFDVFHENVEKALGRPVWTHEFAYASILRDEFLKNRPAPTFEEILHLIPAEKRMVLVVVQTGTAEN